MKGEGGAEGEPNPNPNPVHLAYVVEVAVGAGALLRRLVVAVVHEVQLEARLARGEA